MGKWLIVGISGVTSGGKSTISAKLHSLYPNSHIICMDTYFLSRDDPRNLMVPSLNCRNRDCLGVIDLAQWRSAVRQIVEGGADEVATAGTTAPAIPNFDPLKGDITPSVPLPVLRDRRLLILDGFLALNDPWTASVCHLKFYITLTKEQCLARRKTRLYKGCGFDPVYFDLCLWPEHLKMKDEAIHSNTDLVLLDGSKPAAEVLDWVLQNITTYIFAL